uniref:Uncharacterized protein n=1 Tax=Zea mays TaxID=4577 RepID=C4J1T8_MAIZE|nr:unknown [Zea mays]
MGLPPIPASGQPTDTQLGGNLYPSGKAGTDSGVQYPYPRTPSGVQYPYPRTPSGVQYPYPRTPWVSVTTICHEPHGSSCFCLCRS